jgi:hypothetical protein
MVLDDGRSCSWPCNPNDFHTKKVAVFALVHAGTSGLMNLNVSSFNDRAAVTVIVLLANLIVINNRGVGCLGFFIRLNEC